MVHLIVSVTGITVAILELIHAKSADFTGGVLLSDQKPTRLRPVDLGDSR